MLDFDCFPDPELHDAPFWFYGKYEYEAFRLAELRAEGKLARLKVGYPGNFHVSSPNGVFRLPAAPAGGLTFRAVGAVRVTLDGVELFSALDSDTEHRLELPHAGEVRIELASSDIPALLIDCPDVEYSADGTVFAPAQARKRRDSGEPPHRWTAPTLTVPVLRRADGLFDAGTELYGFLRVRADRLPVMRVGESPEEALNDRPEEFEQSNDLVAAEPGVWRSAAPLALRYVRFSGAKIEAAEMEAHFSPLTLRGAFSADPELDAVWRRSVHTLRLCLRYFQLDGIKRDRLPWAGDLAVGLLANAHTFAAPEFVRDSLRILSSADVGETDANGIADYSLWLLISHWLFQLYFGDPKFLRAEFPVIERLVEALLARRDRRGYLTEKCRWVLIDWQEFEKFSALQILFRHALNCAADLAQWNGEAAAARRWRVEAAELGVRLLADCFDERRGLFRGAPGVEQFTRHANFLALWSKLSADPRLADALESDALPAVGTPYMAGFELLGLVAAGRRECALRKLRAYWGGMMDDWSSTFYEAHDPARRGAARLEFYGRPFGLSLCHEWSAAPAALLPLIFSGAEPLAPGWSVYRERPLPGSRFKTDIPTPAGVRHFHGGRE